MTDWREIKLLPDETTPWSRYTARITQNKMSYFFFSDDFKLRSPVIYKNIQTKSATSIVACVTALSGNLCCCTDQMSALTPLQLEIRFWRKVTWKYYREGFWGSKGVDVVVGTSDVVGSPCISAAFNFVD